MKITPPKRPDDYPDRRLDCQAAIEPAFKAMADRLEAAGTPDYELVDIAVAQEELGGEHATTPAEQSLRELAAQAESAGWTPFETAAALVDLAVARCQAALLTGATDTVAIKAEIRSLLRQAMEKFGPSIELTAIENSWGDTLNDKETLLELRGILETGSIFDTIDVVSDEIEEMERDPRVRPTRH